MAKLPTRNARRLMRSSMTAGFLYALAGAVLWGVNGTISKYVMSNYDVTPLWFSIVRQLGAGALFMACALWRTPRSIPDMFSGWRPVLQLMVIALTSVMFVQLGYLETIDWTNSATATVLQCMSILIVMVYACIKARKAPRRRDVVGAVMALAGVFLLATGGNPSELALPWQGIVWGLVNAFGGAAMSVVPILAIKKWGNFAVNGVSFLMSGIAMCVVCRPWSSMPHMDALGWTLLALSVVVGTFVSFALYLKGVSVIGAVKGTMIDTCEPLAATVTSVLWLGASFTPADLTGFALIIAMVFVTV